MYVESLMLSKPLSGYQYSMNIKKLFIFNSPNTDYMLDGESCPTLEANISSGFSE
jgi:hypothetical protein